MTTQLTTLRKSLLAGGLLLVAIVALAALRPGEAARATSPPPVDTSGVHLTFRSDTVRTAETLTFRVENPAGTPFEYGVAARLDRWQGSQWVPAYEVGASLADRPGEGQLLPAGEELMTRLIGLSAPPHGHGPDERVRLADVPAGWYRLSVDAVSGGPTASGIFLVVPAA